MSMAVEAVYEDQTHVEEYEEVEEAILEDLLQEAEEVALEQELSEQVPIPLEDDGTSEDTDHGQSEEGETSSHDDSAFLEASETNVDVEDINGANEVEWENPEVIEIVEEELVEESLDIENVMEEEEVEEQDFTLITIEEFELNTEAQDLLEDQAEDQFEGVLEENEVQEPDEVPEITELEQHADHVELEAVEDVVHQDDCEEIPDVEELDHYDDYIELEEEEANTDELLDLEETEELQIIEQGDVVDLHDMQEEEGCEEDLIANVEKNLDAKLEEHTDHDNHGEQKEELVDSVLETEEPNTDYVIEEHQSTTLKEASLPAEIETLEKEFSQVPEEYQSVFTPQEQFLAHFAADLSLCETILARQESTTVTEKHELLSSSPYTVSFNTELLPPVSLDHFDEEVSSLEEELAQIESSRAFQHFHEQLQESQLQILTIDPQLSLENLVDDLKLVSQRAPLPEPPPYDFLAELESFEEYEAEARLQEFKNPLYPYRLRRRSLQTLNRVRPEIVQAKASTHSTQQEVPKFESQDSQFKEASVDHQPLPIESNKPSIVSSQKIPPAISAKLKVPSTRGVVKLQIEALNKLLSLDHKMIFTDEPIRVIMLSASSRKEMGEVFWTKLGDFTQKSDVLTYGKRCFVKLRKEPNWVPMKFFLSIVKNRAQREVYNPELDKVAWVVHNKKKGWEYTGNQRIIVEVRMNSFNMYYSRLEEKARTLAADTEQTRVHLSKYDKFSIEYRDKLTFWTHYGYRPPQPTSIYLSKQQRWSVTHVALDGSEILLKALQTGLLSNPNLSKIAEQWTDAHKENVNSSRITLQQQGKQLTLNQILPNDLVKDLQNRKIDINSLNENRGAPYVFKFQLEKIKNDLRNDIRNVLTEYMGLSKSVVENSRIDVDWGIVKDRSKVLGMDIYKQEFRYTFAPDIVVKDQHDKIVAVIQLKGRTQDKHAITATMSVIQIIELIKYHVEHEVPVALVNIKQDEKGLRYEWLIIDKANIPPSTSLKQLIDPNTGLDPLLPRNARSYAFVETIYQILKSQNSSMDLRKEFNRFQNLIQESQLNFQNLRFYKSFPKYLDGRKYWYKLIQKADELGLSSSQNIEFDEFYQKWKKMVVEDFKNRLQNLI